MCNPICIRSFRKAILLSSILAMLMSVIVGCDRSAAGGRNQAKGAALVADIEMYKKLNGQYPPNLEALVPTITKELPKLEGARWEYILEGDEFSLGFRGTGWSDHTGWYNSRDKSWWVDTK